ncbi:hypothetical protein PS2_036161 [Malus domestica]
MEVDGSASTVSRGAQSIPRQTRRQKAFYQFQQQSLPACKPVLTPAWVITTFLLIGAIFIPAGLITLNVSQNVVEIVDQYDAECVPEAFKSNKVAYIKDNLIPKNCSRYLKVIHFLILNRPLANSAYVLHGRSQARIKEEGEGVR